MSKKICNFADVKEIILFDHYSKGNTTEMC